MDPIKDGINWFSYVEGNPIQFIDPLGLYKNNHPYPQYGQYQHPMSPDDIKKYKQGLADRDEKEAKQKILDGNSDTLRRSLNMYFESNKKVPDTPSKFVKPKAFWWEGRHDKKVDIRDKCVKIDEDDEGNRGVRAYSKGLVNLLKDYEGFSATLYDANYLISTSPVVNAEYVKNNPNGDFTIGYGTKVWTKKGSKHYIDDYYGVTLSKEEAHKYMITELNDETLARTLLPMIEQYNLNLNQQQFDALVLFTYQFGEYTWAENTKYTSIRNFVIEGDYSEAKFKGVMKNYKGSKAANGTVARVNDVIELFIYGDYERDYNYDRN